MAITISGGLDMAPALPPSADSPDPYVRGLSGFRDPYLASLTAMSKPLITSSPRAFQDVRRVAP